MTHDPVERLLKDTFCHIRELDDANEVLELLRRQWQDIHSKLMQLIYENVIAGELDWVWTAPIS